MNEKNRIAIKIIQEYESISVIVSSYVFPIVVHKGYHLAFSGGKDSIVVYDLVKKANVKHQIYFAMTTVDPPELLKFIRLFYPEVQWLHPKLSMYKLIIDRGLPIRTSRFCCQELKEYAGNGKLIITGIRAEESLKRKNRKVYEKDTRKDKWYLNPIIDWSEKEIWEYIKDNKLSYPELYDCGMKRIGCIGCPMIYYKKRQRELNKYPKFKAMYIKAIRKRMEKGFFKEFKDEYDVYEWWVGNIGMKAYLAQYKIEFE